MNTHLLRMTERTRTGRRFVGLGQMQPTLLTHERGSIWLRAEDVDGCGNPVWRALRLPQWKREAKALLGELLECQRTGQPTTARVAWDAHRAKQEKAA